MRPHRPATVRAALASSALALALPLAVACGGGSLSVLHAKGKAAGDGSARVDVLNSSGVTIEKLYVATTEAVDKARAAGVAPDSEGDVALWGEDRLGNEGLIDGHTWTSLTLPADRYDVLAVDHDHREQFVRHLAVTSARRYVLEIGSAWTMAR